MVHEGWSDVRLFTPVYTVTLLSHKSWGKPSTSSTMNSSTSSDSKSDNSQTQYLSTTPLIDHQHPLVQSTLKQLTAGVSKDDQRAVAVAIYRYVRDSILFGFSPAFDMLPASAVIRAGVGFCNPKSTLFVALLRGAGIPARQHMVSIHMNVLKGLGPPTNVYGDHAISEVLLDGEWHKVDSYTVDAPLFAAGQARLAAEGGTMGWGVHKDGVNDWDGRSDSFVQYIMPAGSGVHKVPGPAAAAAAPGASGAISTVPKGSAAVRPMSGPDASFSGQTATPDMPMSDRDFGIIQAGDLKQFVACVAGSPFAWQRRWWGRPLFGLAARYCNSTIAALRASKAAA